MVSTDKNIRNSILAITGSTLCRHSIQLITTTTLAHYLLPSEFGLIALSATVISIAQCFRDLGISSAIIQRPACDDRFLSSLFFTSLTLGLFLTAGVASVAPFAAAYYDEPRLASILCALGISIFLSSIGAVQLAVLEREGKFSRVALIETLSHVLATSLAVILAVYGAGAWSLVVHTLLVNAGRVIPASLLVRFRLSRFDAGHLWEIRRYSGFYFLTTIMSQVLRNFDVMIIGKYAGIAGAGAYSISTQICQFPGALLSTPLARVLFPSFCRDFSDNKDMSRGFHSASLLLATAIYPILVFIAVLAAPITHVVLGHRWPDIAALLPIISLNYLMQATLGLTSIIYQATSRTDLMFYNSLGYTTLSCILLMVTREQGVSIIALSCLVSSVLYFWPAHTVPLQIVGSNVRQLVHTVSGPIFCTAAMAVSASCVHVVTKELGDVTTLLVSGATGLIIYVLMTLKINKVGVSLFASLLRSKGKKRDDQQSL